MHRFARLIAAVILVAATSAGTASARDSAAMTLGGTTITFGGGFQYLSLPDIKFTGVGSAGSFHRQTNSEFADYGGGLSGAIDTPLGFWNGYRMTGSVKGFFTNVEDSDRTNCPGNNCVVIEPTDSFGGVGSFTTKTDRDVDYWGGQAEAKFGNPEPVQVRPNLLRNDYFLIGADIRGIDQNNGLHGRGALNFNYGETLDTNYYGGYVGFGGEYSLGFLGVGGLGDRLGLRSYYSARAGLYDASTDYGGRFNPLGSNLPITHLSISDDELAFISSVSFETRKQLGPRTSLSLLTDYEYISSVPSMRYAGGFGITSTHPTRIEDDSAFSVRSMLRLNIALGAAPEPYSEPPLSSQPLK
jgi:hypothetical protein